MRAEVEHRQPFGATTGGGERICLGRTAPSPARQQPARVRPTARSAHMRAWSGRPQMTIQLAMDVAARAPISRSVFGSCASHTASNRRSALGDPVKTPRTPVKASRRALEPSQEARARAAARCIGGVEVDGGGGEQAGFPVPRQLAIRPRPVPGPRPRSPVAPAAERPGRMRRARRPTPHQAHRRRGPVVKRVWPATTSAARAWSSRRVVGLRSA